MHAQLFALATAAAALLLSSSPFVAASHDGSSPHIHRSRAKMVQKRSSTMPAGWKLSAACVTDAAAPNRLLATSSNFMSTLTASVCAASCDSEGYVYAGLQDGHECWCGNTLNNGTTAGVRTDVSNCDMPCTGDSGSNCGGYFALALYSKSNSTTVPVSSSSVRPTTSASVKSVPASTHVATTTAKTSSYVATSAKASTSSTPSSTSAYKLVEDMSGSSFFDHFNFFTSNDPTGGQVKYVSAATAESSKLAYVENGQAVMRVDNTTWLGSGANRNSVRVTSNKAYQTGLMVFDIAAMPYGCSVWPAMWTVGSNWPSNGEIDIIENVNNASVNQLTLHTGASTSCSTTSLQPAAVSTDFMNKECASSPSADTGCGYQDNSPSAFGAGFNAAGGAVFALLIDANDGVSIYKFPRSKIPADITAGSPNPASSAWGTPQAYWPSSNSCQTKEVIGAQNIVFDITLCGGWCSSDYGTSGCPGTCSQMVEDPTNYNAAAWRVNSVKVYQ